MIFIFIFIPILIFVHTLNEITEDATVAMLRGRIINMPFSNSTKYDKFINETYTCIIQGILEMDNHFHMSVQDVKNCFTKYSDKNTVMKANNKLIIEEVKKKENVKEPNITIWNLCCSYSMKI